MDKRWVTVRIGETEAREWVETLRKTRDLLRRSAVKETSIRAAVDLAALGIELGELIELLERGLSEPESGPEVDYWQRPAVQYFVDKARRDATPSSDPSR